MTTPRLSFASLGERAGDDVERPAGRVGHDEAERPGLREAGARQRGDERAGAERCERDAAPHGFLSRIVLTQPSPRAVVTLAVAVLLVAGEDDLVVAAERLQVAAAVARLAQHLDAVDLRHHHVAGAPALACTLVAAFCCDATPARACTSEGLLRMLRTMLFQLSMNEATIILPSAVLL